MDWFSLILQVFSGAIKYIGDAKKANAEKQSANFNRDIANRNALIMDQQSQAQDEVLHRQAESIQGKTVAGYGASGVTSDSASAIDVLASNAQLETLDQLTSKYNFALKKQGYLDQATLYANNSHYSGQAGQLSGTSDLIGTASNMYTKYNGG